MRKYLVYTSAGLHSNVHLWAKKKDRNYDIWVTNYSDIPGNLSEFSDHYNEEKGAKFPNLLKVIKSNPDIISKYSAVMVSDDDIIISPEKIDRMFDLLIENDLWIVVPAFSRFGKISHDTTERWLTASYRYTNFAEVTCPIFKTDKLLSFMETYDPSVTCYGVNWMYLDHLKEGLGKKIVISDRDYCINPHDFWKNTRVREIDKYSSGETRESAWARKKEELGISTFKKKVYEVRKKAWYQVILAIPVFLMEVGFNSLLKSRLVRGSGRKLKRLLR